MGARPSGARERKSNCGQQQRAGLGHGGACGQTCAGAWQAEILPPGGVTGWISSVRSRIGTPGDKVGCVDFAVTVVVARQAGRRERDHASTGKELVVLEGCAAQGASVG